MFEDERNRICVGSCEYAGLVQERDRFEEFAIEWHQAVETASVLLGFPGAQSPPEFLNAIRQHVEAQGALRRAIRKELVIMAHDIDYVVERLRGKDGSTRAGTLARRCETALNLLT